MLDIDFGKNALPNSGTNRLPTDDCVATLSVFVRSRNVSVRHFVELHGGRSLHRTRTAAAIHRQRVRSRKSVHDSRGRRSVSDRTTKCGRRTVADQGQRNRSDHETQASLWLARFGVAQVHAHAQRLHCVRIVTVPFGPDLCTNLCSRSAGLVSLAITKLDILDEFDEIKVAVSYQLDNQTCYVPPCTFFSCHSFPASNLTCDSHIFVRHDTPKSTANTNDLARVQPNYITLKGWKSDISKARQFDQLPIEAQEYIRTIEKHLNVPGKYLLLCRTFRFVLCLLCQDIVGVC
jgi:hypothetical protein